MTNEEKLRESKAGFDDVFHEVIDSILFQPWPLGDAVPVLGLSRSLMMRLGQAAQVYKDALIQVAETAPQEVAEDYRQRAESLAKEPVHLIRVLLEHRKRRERGQNNTSA